MSEMFSAWWQAHRMEWALSGIWIALGIIVVAILYLWPRKKHG